MSRKHALEPETNTNVDFLTLMAKKALNNGYFAETMPNSSRTEKFDYPSDVSSANRMDTNREGYN
ncbi:hypothetical protein OLMES_3562 [Oleiphilus messinensis]|uniref:Uncharacterized protein n=1 Tax=Oleiphilus messinensis TaxID=141451 RepID=A0A1Y0IAN7_9GAMM|nr:hypothetical protein OLMES_3562 [Oleiphilus messinensis]